MNDPTATAVRPRLGFVGVGWIGLNRMRSILDEDCADAVVIADPSREALRSALALVPDAISCDGLDAVLDEDVDGVVLATPSGLHAEQAARTLGAGKAVFCQKPLGRTAAETRSVIEAARRNDRLLGVDFSYRHTRAMQAVRDVVRSGAVGRVYAAELFFHNAYGPDKHWALDPDLSGGGCLIDLGIHLVDLLMWTLDESEMREVRGALFKGGRRLQLPTGEVEDFARGELEFSSGTVASLACSWHFNAGRDAIIRASFYGTHGSVTFRNVDGSFYDFASQLHRGSDTQTLVAPPDSWSGRAAVAWAERLAGGQRYDGEVEDAVIVADILDRIYGR